MDLSVHEIAGLLGMSRIYFSDDGEAGLLISWASELAHAQGKEWMQQNRFQLGNAWVRMAREYRKAGEFAPYRHTRKIKRENCKRVMDKV